MNENGSSEGPLPQCADGMDNDADGFIDFGSDPHCKQRTDNREVVDPLPTLTRSATKGRIRSALRQEFGAAYRHGSGKVIRRCDRRSRIRVRCNAVSWFIGDVGFDGWAAIWYGRDDDGDVWWNYALRLKRTNWYCVDRKRHGDPAYRGKRCSKTYRVD